MNLLADVIFPAFEAPYVAPLLFPVAGLAAILAEVAVYWLLNRRSGIGKLIGIVVVANVVSTIAGFIIAALMPTGLVPKVVGEREPPIEIIQPGPQFGTYMILGFLLAYVLSIAIEYGVVRLCAGWASIGKPLLTVTLANLASYAALIAVAWVWAQFVW